MDPIRIRIRCQLTPFESAQIHTRSRDAHVTLLAAKITFKLLFKAHNFFHPIFTTLKLILSSSIADGSGHFEFKTLFLLRSYYESAYRWGSGHIKRSSRESKPSKDHQGQVRVFTARRSSTRRNCPSGPRSATRGRFAHTSPYTPRAMPRCARASAAPKGSPA